MIEEVRLKGTNRRADLAVPTRNVVVEIHGMHHDQPVFGGAKFREQLDMDERKRQFLMEKGIRLVEVKLGTERGLAELEAKAVAAVLADTPAYQVVRL